MNKPNHNDIGKSALLVTLMMFLFKLLGFVKQAVLAYTFGATSLTDSYFIAWGFISGISEAMVKSMSVSLVAVYTSLRIREGKREAAKLINGVIELVCPVFVLIAVMLIISSPTMASVLAPSYNEGKRYELIQYLKVLAPVLVFGCFEMTLGSVFDSHKSFFIPRLQSLIYSVSVILFCFALSSTIGVTSLVLAQYSSSALFSLILVLFVRRYHSFFFIKLKDIPELKTLMKTALPLFIGNSVLQLNQIVDKSLSSALVPGATSALSYCHTLEQLVTNIMIVNIGNVLFANFTTFVAEDNLDSIQRSLSRALNLLICLLVGLAVIVAFMAEDIVSIVYMRGNFSNDAVLLTSAALVGYAFSFPAVAVRDLTVKSLYAFKETTKPMLASILSIAVNICLSVTLSRMLGLFGIAFATSISALIGMLLNANSLKKYVPSFHYSEQFVVAIKCLPGAFVLAVICMVEKRFLTVGHLSAFLLAVGIGSPLYLMLLYLVKIEEIQLLARQCLSHFQGFIKK